MKGFGEIWQPLPRWAVLPGDPPSLKRWLSAQATKDTPIDDEAGLPPEPPEEDGWRAAS